LNKKCLACWEEIPESNKVCPFCGSDQKEVAEYLSFAILAQQNRTIEAPEGSSIVQFLQKVDPEADKVIKQKFATPEVERQPYIPTSIKAAQPSYTPLLTQEQKPESTEKLVECPHCGKEVRDRKFCKFCGGALKKECPQCHNTTNINDKFCFECGYRFEQE